MSEMNKLSHTLSLNTLHLYSQGVIQRLRRHIWLFLIVFAILFLNALFVGSGVQNGGGWSQLTVKGLFLENHLFLLNILWVAFMGIMLPSLIPHKVIRIILIVLELILLLLLHFIDIYLIGAYGIPFNESFVFTLFGTNPNEAKAFLRTLQIDWHLFLIEIVKLVICAGVAVGIQFLLNRRRVNTR